MLLRLRCFAYDAFTRRGASAARCWRLLMLRAAHVAMPAMRAASAPCHCFIIYDDAVMLPFCVTLLLPLLVFTPLLL